MKFTVYFLVLAFLVGCQKPSVSIQVPEDYKVGAPEDWTWPENRIDQWGMSDKDFAGLKVAEETFRFHRTWQPAPLN